METEIYTEVSVLTFNGKVLMYNGRAIPVGQIAMIQKYDRRDIEKVRYKVSLKILIGMSCLAILSLFGLNNPMFSGFAGMLLIISGSIVGYGIYERRRKSDDIYNSFGLIIERTSGVRENLVAKNNNFRNELFSGLANAMSSETPANIYADFSRQEVVIDKMESKVTMGDKIKIGDVSGGSVVNVKSKVENSYNKVKSMAGGDTADALMEVARIVEDSQNRAAVRLLQDFQEELDKKKPNKRDLRSLWEGLVSLLPALGAASNLAERIAKLF